MKNKFNFLSLWLPVIFCAGLIFYLSSQSELPYPELEIPLLDKFEHMLAFGILGLCLYRAAYFTWENSRYLAFKVICLVLAYGISDEIHQIWTPHRTPDVFDVMFDTLGGLLATQLVFLRRLATNPPGETLSFLFKT